MAEKFTVSMNVDNIGPHYGENKLSFSEEVDSNKAIFYATNGTGKSFISRAFRLCTPSKANMTSDEILTIGKQGGKFSFGIHSSNVDKKLEVVINRGKAPVINNSSGLLFHVFNSDYVEENIKPKHYSPDGNIEGYILGKVQIDLTEEKRMENEIKGEIETEDEAIDGAIDDAKSFLRQHGVTTNTTEYQEIARNKVECGFEYDISDTVEDCVRKIKALENVPENLSDIDFPLLNLDFSFLDSLSNILMTVFPKSEWDEEFVKEYKEHQSFVEEGLDCEQADRVCPFCKREYDLDALNLISRYKQYRNDKEAQVVGQLREKLQLINQMCEMLDEEERKISSAEAQLIILQKYFPSLASSQLEKFTEVEKYKTAISTLSEMISKKIDSLYLPLNNVEDAFCNFKKAWEEIEDIQKKNKGVIDVINKTKNDSRTERLSLRKNLCKAKSIALQDELREKLKCFNEKQKRLKEIQEEIRNKEQQERVSKRDKVYETLESSLNRFFNGKYQIDKETFHIKFFGNSVGANASSILSDGEKSIVAFCWYLAETHTIVNSEDDYNKLFFIIDDPISSMDFHFVYAVAQSIKDIKYTFGISTHERIWMFTHNNEFFSIVMRNNILAKAFIMKPGSIEIFNHQLLMPYENHLFDLTRIANGQEAPNHTTGNSIRHVIETIAKFENPETGIATYVNNEEMLSKDACIFALCQDLSHGNVRLEPPYSDDVLRAAAKMVIDFVKAKYPGQLKCIKE